MTTTKYLWGVSILEKKMCNLNNKINRAKEVLVN